jgi:digeranylgeranylglycerophospholipid reductase
MESDFLVVGGGPVGTTFASLVAKRARTVVLEEHPCIGEPVQCTGLVAPRVVELAGAQRTILNRLNGAIFHFPGGQDVEVFSRETKAVVLDRAGFDRICAERAIRNGAEILLGERYVDGALQSDGVLVRSQRGSEMMTHEAKLAIGADGYKSNLSKLASLERAKDSVRGIQLDLEHEEERQDVVDVYIGRQVAPGFFSWKIPCGRMTRIGVCTSKDQAAPIAYLSKLLKDQGLEDCRRLKTVSGMIPIGPPPRTYSERVMVIGDAAGQAKPLSGGGLYTGMMAAKHAAETALTAMESGDFSAAGLASYQERWRADIGKELDRSYQIRKAYLRLSDKKLEAVGRMLNKDEVREVLSTGDIDFPSQVAPQVLKAAPGLLKLAPQFLRSVFSR